MRFALAALLALLLSAPALAAPRPGPSPAAAVALSQLAPAEKVAPESPKERLTKIHDILSRSEFSGSQRSLWDTFTGWIRRILGRIFRALFGISSISPSGGRAISITLAVAVLVLFLFLLAWVLAKVGVGRLVRRERDDLEELYAGPDTPSLAMDEAAAAATSGDFRSALRLVYLAVLLRLDERDFIRFDRTGTNWEYLRALRKHPDLQKIMRPMTVTFDRKWYGHETAGDAEYRSFVGTYRAVEAAEPAEATE